MLTKSFIKSCYFKKIYRYDDELEQGRTDFDGNIFIYKSNHSGVMISFCCPAPSQPIFCIQEAYRDRVPVIRGYWQAVQRILRLLHLWEGLPFQCGVMWDDRMGIRSKPKYWRSILSYMPLNNSPLFGLLGSQSCIEHNTRLQGYRGFPPNQFCPPPSSNMTMTTAPPSTPPTRLVMYSGSKSNPPTPSTPFAEPIEGVCANRLMVFHTPNECPLQTLLYQSTPFL